jgi:hypothetical protein
MKFGNINFLEPFGPLEACNGTALPFPYKRTQSVATTNTNWSIIGIYIHNHEMQKHTQRGKMQCLLTSHQGVPTVTTSLKTVYQQTFYAHWCHFRKENTSGKQLSYVRTQHLHQIPKIARGKKIVLTNVWREKLTSTYTHMQKNPSVDFF